MNLIFPAILLATCLATVRAQQPNQCWGAGQSGIPGSWYAGFNTCKPGTAPTGVPAGGTVGAAAVGPTAVGNLTVPPSRVYTGLFVHTWHDIDGHRRVMGDGNYTFGWWWWGRPAWAQGRMLQYSWSNPAMVDYHINNFIKLKVDFIYLDFTNGPLESIRAGAHALCARLAERGDGPRVVFWIKSVAEAGAYWEEYYAAYPQVMFQWEGKPLLLIHGLSGGWKQYLGMLRPLPSGGDLDRYTVRWCWGLLRGASGTMWSFKEDFSNPRPYMFDGRAEQIGMAFASQGLQVMSVDDDRRQCRQDGAFFKSQIANVLAHRPRIVTVTGYNEWMSINLNVDGSPPLFTDLYLPECSHDIEPMQGGHRARYFLMTQRFIFRLRQMYAALNAVYRL